MSEPLFLGLDLSTQQLKALLLDEKAVVVHSFAVGYDKDLPHYGTTNGATHGPEDGQVTSPVAMWVEALDLILKRMRDAGVDFSQIRAVSGAGQVCPSQNLSICGLEPTCRATVATWLRLLVELCSGCSRFAGSFQVVALATQPKRILYPQLTHLARLVHDTGVPRTGGNHRWSPSTG